VVVIGAGFIGAEAAATTRGNGHQVTIVEAMPVPLSRALGPQMGQACAELHRDHGVEVLLGTGVDGFEGTDGVSAVRLADGRRLPADVVVVGIGVVPATAWLDGSGIEQRDGVVCDETLATSAPGVYAAGDLVRWPNALFDGEEMRVEHWTNAAEQGAAAANNLVRSLASEQGEPYAPVPFFWSDQYDHRIQFLGRAGADDAVQIVFGSVAERSFLALYRRGERLHGVLGLDQTKRLMRYRRLLMDRVSWDEAVAYATA